MIIPAHLSPIRIGVRSDGQSGSNMSGSSGAVTGVTVAGIRSVTTCSYSVSRRPAIGPGPGGEVFE
jgi:hypothetical protein